MLDSSGVPFMIAGSFASTAHGMPRTTQDLDVVIDPPSPQQSGGSERQRRDVAGIVATMGEQLDRAYVERWIRQLGLEEEWAVALKTSV
jgi:hypothetical protein